MKHLVLFIAISAFSLPLKAQLGFSGSYTWFQAPAWESNMEAQEEFEGEFFFQNGYQLGLDYWFRLKNARIEFFPEGRFASYRATPHNFLDQGELKWQSLSFHFTTNVYPLNFFGDCECPTWSKQEPIFEKGFFLQVSPGVHYLIQSYQSDTDLGLYRDVTDLAYSLGLGAGLDIGISDWITITPYGRITRVFDGEWENFDSLPLFSDQWDPTMPFEQPYTLWIPEAGLRLGLRWKH